MKRIVAWMLVLLLMISACACAEALRTEDEPMEPVYVFDLSVNGKHELAVQPGDILTVVFSITRMDEDELPRYSMYSMQNEIEYDDAFVQPVENGCITQAEIDTQDIALRGDGRAFYMNYLSLLDGSEWKDEQLVGTFQLQVNSENGVTELINDQYCVTKQDATQIYEAISKDLILYVSDDCTVRFETNGAGEVEDAVANYGEFLVKPEDPVKDGWHLRGWYKDYDLTEEWDFDVDVVAKNMVLYAAWDEGEPEKEQPEAEPMQEVPMEPVKRVCVRFETFGGEALADIWVEENQPIAELPEAVREGYVFCGWYKDERREEPWDAQSDCPSAKRTVLYAAWEKEQ